MVSKIPPSGSFKFGRVVIWVRHYRTHRRGWTMEEAWEDSERKVWNYCSEPVDGHGAQWEEASRVGWVVLEAQDCLFFVIWFPDINDYQWRRVAAFVKEPDEATASSP